MPLRGCALRASCQAQSGRLYCVPLTLAVLLAANSNSVAQPPRVPHAVPHRVGVKAERLSLIDGLVEEALSQQKMPGCVVTIGRQGHIVYQKAYGYRQLEPEQEPMTVDTVFDLASLTKPIATGTSVLVLLERGSVRVRNKVADYLPEFANHDKDDIRVQQLLTHQSGLKPFLPIEQTCETPEAGWQAMFESELRAEPGSEFIYSDINFMLLGKIVERASGQSLHEFANRSIFGPLGMTETGFLPAAELHRRSATTQQREGRWMRGEVHDPRAYFLGGVAGHAGLFSTADDLAVFAQMMLGKGTYQGVRILSPQSVALMTAAYDVGRGTRGLGWDKQSPYSSNRSELMSEQAFGHGGFTGTGIWIDPELDLFVIFLSNRVHPDGSGNVNDLIGRIGSVAVAAIEPPGHNDRDAVTGFRQAGLRDRHPTADREAHVLNGVDVLERDNFQQLAGRRVGLITNHTGHNRQRVSTVELLRQAANVELVALFSPEHGFAGRLDEPTIADARDAESGLVIYSLYGENRKPTAEMLQGIDTLVFDIQDIGTRFYTYISTMGLALEAAAEQGLTFVVLDRVNPIGGHLVEGPLLDAGRESFVGFHPIAVRHGMTAGELAQMFREERGWQSLDLQIVPIEGWQREMYFDETGLPWTNPSPNMRSLTEAVLYPGIGLLETTNVSVGRGTDTPFEVVGAPWIDGRELAWALRSEQLPGVVFVPVQFTPTASKFAGQSCGGINIVVTDRDRLRPVKTGLAIARQLQLLYAGSWDVANFIRLLGNKSLYDGLVQGEKVEQIEAAATPAQNDFLRRREQYLSY